MLIDHIAAGDGCWQWAGYINPRTGYGRCTPQRPGGSAQAHRAVYELFRGVELERVQHLDHLCSNRTCVNPDHLEVTTQTENNRRTAERGRHPKTRPWLRKSVCKRGHDRTNPYPNGTCRQCAIDAATNRDRLLRKEG